MNTSCQVLTVREAEKLAQGVGVLGESTETVWKQANGAARLIREKRDSSERRSSARRWHRAVLERSQKLREAREFAKKRKRRTSQAA